MPEHVQESDLDFSHFHCCGDEDLYPFGCRQCGHKMVWCYECDTLYRDLADTTVQDVEVNHFDDRRRLEIRPGQGAGVNGQVAEVRDDDPRNLRRRAADGLVRDPVRECQARRGAGMGHDGADSTTVRRAK